MKRLAAIFLTTAQVLGCGGDDKEDKLSSVEGFCEQWAIRACNDAVVDACSAVSRDECVVAQRAFCENLVPVEKYSRTGAEACLGLVESAYKDARLNYDERQAVLFLEDPCNGILSGAGGPDDECDSDGDCSSEVGLTCVIQAGMTTGTCQEAEVVGGGRSCDEPNQVCEEGFYCNGANCIERAGEGDPCTTTEPCAEALKCERPDGTPPGAAVPDGGAEPADATCVARLAVGEDCGDDEDCTTGICAGATDTATGVCSNNVVLSPTDPICRDLR